MPKREQTKRASEYIRASGYIRASAPPLTGSDDDLLSTDQVATMLNCSKDLLEDLRARGDGPIFVEMTPRHIRYRRGDVKAFVLARRKSRQGAPQPALAPAQ